MKYPFAVIALTYRALPVPYSPQSATPRRDIPAMAKAANRAIVSIVMSNTNGSPIAQGVGGEMGGTAEGSMSGRALSY